MKNISKIILFFCLLLVVTSCVNDKEPIASPQGFELKKDQSLITPIVLLQNAELNNYIKLVWNEADYTVKSSSSKYIVLINDADKDPEALNAVEYEGITTNEDAFVSATLTIKEFNTMLNKLPTFKCGQMNINFRVKSILGSTDSNSISQFSTFLNVKVTAYNLQFPKLAIVSSSNIGSSSTSPKLLSSSFTSMSDLEGFAYLQAGNYKFAKPDACGDFTTPIVIGKGAGAGTLETTGAGLDINVPTTGYYYITADLVANTYSFKEYRSICINGTGTKSLASPAPIPLDDSDKDNVWTATLSLIKGRNVRFQSTLWSGPLTPGSNGAADYIPITNTVPANTVILGFSNATELKVVPNAPGNDIGVPGVFAAGARDIFKVTVDMRNPRKYIYSFVKI